MNGETHDAETHGQKQMMEDTHRGEQAQESDTTAEADWWLKTDELWGK